MVVLVLAGIAVVTKAGLAGLVTNSGPRGFTIARPGPYIWVDGIRSVPATISWRGTMRAKAITSASARSGDDRPRFLAPSLLRAQQGDQATHFPGLLRAV